jgi:hypothetical protein
MLNLFAFRPIQCLKDGVQLGVGPGVESELKYDGSNLISMGSFLAIGTGAFVLEVLFDADRMEDMPAIKTANPLCQFLQANRTGRYLIKILTENWLFVRFRHSRPT